MRHLLEAIVRANNAMLQLPMMNALGQEAGYRMRRSEHAATALTEMLAMELGELERSGRMAGIANINPLQRKIELPLFKDLVRAVDTAARAHQFGEAVEQVRMAWFCLNENSVRVSAIDVFPGTPHPPREDGGPQEHGNLNEQGFQAYCATHNLTESVELRVTEEQTDEEIEEAEFHPGPEVYFRIRTAPPQWLVDRWINDGHEVTPQVGDEGRILWDERLVDELGNRSRGWYVRMDDNRWEGTLPTDILGASRNHR